MKGVYGKTLLINLSERTSLEDTVEDRVYEKFLGGKGLGSHLLLEKNPPGVDPLAPENLLILALGPATGLPVWGANRIAAYTKSPLTGIYSESYSGGRAYLEMSRVGYDAFLLQGALDRWSFLEVRNGQLTFHDAGHLSGKDALETEALLREQYKGQKAAIITIGPAGENLVKFAYANNDRGRSFGRTGIGAVMGSKKLKALVFLGDRAKQAADEELLQQYRKSLLSAGKEHPATEAYRRYGTSQLINLTAQVEALPSRYWQEGTVPHLAGIDREALLRECDVKVSACGHCFISCVRSTTVAGGRHKGLTLDGPEYETIFAFGALNYVDDIKEIAYLNDLCDRLGLDTISAGNVTAFAIEAHKRGRLDFPIDYGQVDRIAELLHLIAYRQGVGDLLAEGVRAAAAELGMQDMAIHVKGLEPPGYEPRYLQGMALAYAVSDRGACHLRTNFYKPELAGLIDPHSNEGKAQMFLEYEDRMTILDTLILCRFYRDLVLWDACSTIVKGTLGLDLQEDDLKGIAANVAHTVREFNLREGMTPEDDTLPACLFDHPLGSKGVVLPRERFEELLGDYYRLRGFAPRG